MRDYFSVTITDSCGSHYYTIKKSTKRLLLLGVCLGLAGLLAMFVYNYVQFQLTATLHERNAVLQQQLDKFEKHNTLLIDKVATHITAVRDIEQAVEGIEEFSGVEPFEYFGDRHSSLVTRVDTIRRFYSAKEDEYTEIGKRVEQLEAIVQRKGKPVSGTPSTLIARLGDVAISTNRAHILHSNIPSGFPTARRRITSDFGMRLHPVRKTKLFHHGSDLRAKSGEPVRATANGVVRAADNSKRSGNRVIVQHNYGFETYYAHLHEMHVEPGDIVFKGQVIGLSGNSGLSAAPHLHYEVRYLRQSIDPSSFLRWDFGAHEIFTQVKKIQWPSLINLINNQITQQTLQLSQLEPSLPEN